MACKFICLNIQCMQKQLRIFNQNQINMHPKCEGWILNTQQINNLLNEKPLQKNYQEINYFDYRKQPIKSLFLLQFLLRPKTNLFSTQNINFIKEGQNDPIILLRYNFNQIRIKFQTQLQKQYYKIEQKILKLKQVKFMFSMKDQATITQYINQSKILSEYKCFCNVQSSLTLINQNKINKEIHKITQSIQNIRNSFWYNQPESIKKQNQRLQKAQYELQKMLNSQQFYPAQKYTIIANSFNIKSIQPFVSQDKLTISLTCWLCNTNCTGTGNNIKQRKCSTYQQMLQHLHQDHLKIVTSKYLQKVIMKNDPNRVTFSQFLTQIQQKKYNQFIIIDKQNKNKDLKAYERIRDDVFVIDVVSKQNQNIASGKYIVADSQGKDSADILMVMMIYAIIRSGYFRFSLDKRPKITLVTSDHFGQTFKGILKKQFGVQIQVSQ